MARTVRWTEAAAQDLAAVAAFIGRDSRFYAAALVRETRAAARSLRTFTERGRMVPEIDAPDIREPRYFREMYTSCNAEVEKEPQETGDFLTAIYVLVSDKELPENLAYEMLIFGTMRSEEYGCSEHRKCAQILLDQVEAALGEADGIDVKETCLKSEADISLEDRRLLKRWDFDDLTVRGYSGSDLPPHD